MLRNFLSAGCLRADGTLSIGWHGEFLPVRQMYSGPGSPYWAAKGFAGLLLPAGDPVWRSGEEPLPVERGDFTRVARAPGWVISGTSADGIIRVANHGTDHTSGEPGEADDPFYCRWSYSTRTGPDLGGPDLSDGVDCGVSLIGADGRPSGRRPLELVHVSGRAGVSRHQAHWPSGAGEPAAAGPWLTTASVVRGCWEVRLVRVAADAPAGPWTLRIGGWPVAAGEPPAAREAPGTALARAADELTSCVIALHGTMNAEGAPSGGAARVRRRHAAVPFLRSAGPVRPGETYAAAVALSGDPAGPGEPPRLAIGPGEAGDLAVVIRWADGEQDQLTL